jgi:hypothetical protein
VIGASFVIGMQFAAILSLGAPSQFTFLRSEAVVRSAPDVSSALWWPARAVWGELSELAIVMGVGVTVLTSGPGSLVPTRNRDYSIGASGLRLIMQLLRQQPNAGPTGIARGARGSEVDLRRRMIVPRPGTTARGRPAPRSEPAAGLHCAATHEVRRPAAGRALADLSRPEASFPNAAESFRDRRLQFPVRR